MPTYHAPVRDSLFVLNEVLHFERYHDLPTFGEASAELVSAILTEGGKFAEEVLQPLNQIGDTHGCVRQADGSVTTAPGFRAAYMQWRATQLLVGRVYPI